MKKVAACDLKDVVLVSRRALECCQTDKLRSEMLCLLEQIFKADSANFFITCNEQLSFERIISRNIEEKFLTQYRQYYHRLDPFLGRSFPSQSGILTTEQIISYKDLMPNEYYNDFLRPQLIHFQMTFYLKSADRLLGLVALFRPRSAADFSALERAKAELIAPHLAGALEKTIIIEQIARNKKIIESITADMPYTGIIILDESLELIYQSEYATQIVSILQPEGKPREKSILDLPAEVYSHCKELKEFASMKERFEPDQKRIRLVTSGAKRQVLVHIRLIPFNEKSFLFLIYLEPEEPIFSLCQGLRDLGLSRRELDVVNLLYLGLKNAEIADKLYISEHTVENHLKSIYEKMDVKNRTSLIHRLIHLTRSASWGGLNDPH
jgi:DNA-binding CsgD family transcriptional regulator